MEPFLPHDIMIEILSWLPVESLLRFKCVCKQWYSLIQDRRFTIKHWMQSNPVAFFDKELDGDNFKFVTCGYGLVLEMNNVSKKYCIRNVSTRQILDLPDPQKSSYGMKLFNIPNTTDLKVISMSKTDFSEDCEILTIGIDEQWRPVKLPASIFHLGKEKHIAKFRVEFGALHWIRLIADGSNLCIRVDSLDMGSECFSTCTLPQGFFSYLNKVEAISWYGHLAFADIVEENLNVMVLENCREQKWSEIKIIIPLTFLKEDLVLSFAHSKRLLFWNDEKIVSYDIKSGKITDIPKLEVMGYVTYVTVPSLITFKGMQPEKTPTRDEPVKDRPALMELL